ncbi:MAG: aminopeptidase P family protein [Bacteroidales bacterium]|nr:aminopeptidase P family protein [Bacteroidales bacterium]
MENSIPQRIELLRKAMVKKGLEAYIVPSTDPHISEYIASRWKSREWISGFNGSAGTVVVTLEDAGLWTDSRYFLQAEQQLTGSGIDLFKQGLPETPDMLDWIVQNIPAGSAIGLDGGVFTTNEVFRINAKVVAKGFELIPDYDLFEEIWADRPGLPKDEIFDLPVKFSGVSATDKIAKMRQSLTSAEADLLILTALDDVAWTFNVRGSDVECNPVAIAYAVVSQKDAILFVEGKKVNADIIKTLSREGITVAEYAKVEEYLENLAEGTSILFDGNKVNYALCSAIPTSCKMIETTSPVALLKAVKNETELSGIRNAMEKDGVALTKFFRWLEQAVPSENVKETTIEEKLLEFRSEQEHYVGESFSTIAGYAGHGAIVHYHATPESASTLKNESFVLVDSGGQYFDGTTDITRTIALCEPTTQMKIDYTLVLKGHIAIATCRFPQGTRGAQIDVLARKALWDQGFNYLHGTGHGVGHFLNVHEGPQNIRMDENPTKLVPGMVISNEPGLYRTNEYGIRTENLVVVKEDIETPFGKFYAFETLTLFPFDKKSMDLSLLTDKEIAWINDYHQTVYDRLSPKLNTEEQAWMREKTTHLPNPSQGGAK